MKKRLLAIGCAAAVLLGGCGAPSKAQVTTASQEETTTQLSQEETEQESSGAEASQDKFIQVTDMNGRVVEVPKEINSVVLTALPLPSIYALSGAPIDKLKGVHPGSSSAIDNSIMSVMYPELVGIADNFIGGTDINVEELLKIHPDVVIYWAEYENQYEALKKVGIPAVGVKGAPGGDVIQTLSDWLDIMGQIFGTTGNTEKVITYADQVKKEVGDKLEGLSDKDKPKVLYLYNHSSDEISVSGSNFYGGYWINSAGGINVAADIDTYGSVNMEQIYEWDPDIIILTTFTNTMPDDLYNGTITGQDWSNISAVKNKKVYKEPLGVYRWFPPSGDAPLMFRWMAQILHPDLFTYDMKDEIISYYKQFYNYDLTPEQAQGILNASPDAAKGAGFGGSGAR